MKRFHEKCYAVPELSRVEVSLACLAPAPER